MPICMSARYQVRKDRLDLCKKTVEEFVKYIRANEPATLFYMAMQEPVDETRFLHVMVFENEQAITAHQASPATRRFVETIYPSTLEPLDFREYNVLGYKGAEDIEF
ncbi:MAG: antibiotic biosynthesis monooxygenase [Nitrospina sp.]|nr:antibiotic biosynthesis monooxygenase [Nitrospina sp.]